MPSWSPEQSESLYNVANWGGGFFSVNGRGNVEVHPGGDAESGQNGIDLEGLIEDIRRRGIELPLLLRFGGILRSRVRQLGEAFAAASREFGFGGK